jgi:hypothetical protein
MQRFEICDFVCKKVEITRDWESRGDLRYIKRGRSGDLVSADHRRVMGRPVSQSPYLPPPPLHKVESNGNVKENRTLLSDVRV